MLPNRDLLIPIDCYADGVRVPGVPLIPLSALARSDDPKNPLLAAVRQIIDRRQSTFRAGEAPYQAHIRFFVRPEGLRAYYLAFPALEVLKAPMTRENVKVEDGDN